MRKHHKVLKVLLLAYLMQCAYGVYSANDVLAQRVFLDGKVKAEARHNVGMFHFIPFIAIPVFVYDNVEVAITGFRQSAKYTVESVSDFPIEHLKCTSDGKTVQIYDDRDIELDLYAVFVIN